MDVDIELSGIDLCLFIGILVNKHLFTKIKGSTSPQPVVSLANFFNQNNVFSKDSVCKFSTSNVSSVDFILLTPEPLFSI